MKIEEIKELVALLEQSELNVLEISEGDSRIRLEKAAAQPVPGPAGMTIPVSAFAQGMPMGGIPAAVEANGMYMAGNGVGSAQGAASGAMGVPGGAAGAAAAAAPPAGKAVKSPMVGVFYGAPAPGEEPFVSVGSRVEKGQVVCIVEAMKLMNEIASEVSGEIVEICCADGEVVEYGQPLFYVR